ncbi:MAG: DPP IV N-terminal domain-containing protein, partial [Pseudomonadota bacterium]
MPIRRLVQTLVLCTAAALLALPGQATAQTEWTPERSLEVQRLSDLAFSPDGAHLLYGVNSTDVARDAYLTRYVVMDASGAAARTILPASEHISAAQWSPDGRSVAYISSEGGTAQVWRVNADGSDQRQLTDTVRDVASFRWAPDGEAIAFTMLDGTDGDPVEDSDVFASNRLWLLPLKGGEPGGPAINLTEDQPFSVSGWSGAWAYDWAPDGKAIAFAYQARPGLQPWTEAQVATVDVGTKAITKVETGNNNWTFFPRYSPDGKWLAFVNAPGAFKWSFLWDVGLWPVGGGETVKLPPSKNRLPFIWQWAP